MNPKTLESTVKSNLSAPAKSMLETAHQMAELLEKAHKKSKDFSQNDWDKSMQLVDRLNAICSGT